jgi:hypothetical protein
MAIGWVPIGAARQAGAAKTLDVNDPPWPGISGAWFPRAKVGIGSRGYIFNRRNEWQKR